MDAADVDFALDEDEDLFAIDDEDEEDAEHTEQVEQTEQVDQDEQIGLGVDDDVTIEPKLSEKDVRSDNKDKKEADANCRSRIVRIVPPNERTTDQRLQKTEAAYIISMRAQQISQNATHFADAPNVHDPVAIAYLELFQRMCPLKLRRRIGVNSEGEALIEEWDVNLMTLSLPEYK